MSQLISTQESLMLTNVWFHTVNPKIWSPGSLPNFNVNNFFDSVFHDYKYWIDNNFTFYVTHFNGFTIYKIWLLSHLYNKFTFKLLFFYHYKYINPNNPYKDPSIYRIWQTHSPIKNKNKIFTSKEVSVRIKCLKRYIKKRKMSSLNHYLEKDRGNIHLYFHICPYQPYHSHLYDLDIKLPFKNYS